MDTPSNFCLLSSTTWNRLEGQRLPNGSRLAQGAAACWGLVLVGPLKTAGGGDPRVRRGGPSPQKPPPIGPPLFSQTSSRGGLMRSALPSPSSTRPEGFSRRILQTKNCAGPAAG